MIRMLGLGAEQLDQLGAVLVQKSPTGKDVPRTVPLTKADHASRFCLLSNGTLEYQFARSQPEHFSMLGGRGGREF
jgi:hypothetical protein